MRFTASLLLALTSLALLAPGSDAQVITLPLADYNGSLKLGIVCSDGSKSKLKTKGAVTIESQVGANFVASAELLGKKSGADCTVTLDLTGAVNMFGRVQGTYTSSIACSDGSMSTGFGTFDGQYLPGKLAVSFDGEDDAGRGDACIVVAKFKGKGSPGNALCAALTQRAIGKLSKQFYGAWSKRIKLANIPATVQVLQAAIAKAEAGFTKAATKAQAKSDKAGGTCAKPLTNPVMLTTALKSSTIDPMIQGFNVNSPGDRFVRGKIAKMQGQYFVSRLKAETVFGLKLNPIKLAASLQKARDKFVNDVTKVLTKATNQGFNWNGIGPQLMADDTETLVDQLVVFYK